MNKVISPVAIIGAGISGLAAYRTLRNLGIRAVVFEKSRGCGGRAATRRVNGIVADLGAQFMAISRDDLKQLLNAQSELIVTVSGLHGNGNHPRYIHREGMSALVKSFVADLDSAGDLRFLSRLRAIRHFRDLHDSRPIWELALDSGEIFHAETLLFTTPLPQSLEIFEQSGLELGRQDSEILREIHYNPCFSLVVGVEPSSVPEAAMSHLPIWKFPSPTIDGIYDQRGKGLHCTSGTWVVHASGPWSMERWGAPDEVVTAELISELRTVLGCRESEAGFHSNVLHRWRYAEPCTQVDRDFFEPRFLDEDCPPLLLAGDAFVRSSAEGAFASGVAAGKRLGELLCNVPCGGKLP